MVRWAHDHEGLLVQDLLRRGKTHALITENLDWAQPLGRSWLVIAPQEGRFDACINVAYSRPIGRIEMLCADPALPKRTQARYVHQLCYAAAAVLHQAGCQATGSYIGDHEPTWQAVFTKRRGIPLEHGTYFLRKV